MSDDVKKAGVRPVVHPNPDVTRLNDRDVPATDEAVADAYVQAGPKSDSSVGPANALFRSREDTLQEAARLRELMKSSNHKKCFLATSDYKELLADIEDDSLEVYAGAAALRELMTDSGAFVSGAFVDRMAIDAYEKLTSKFSEAQVYVEAAALRELMGDPCGDVMVRAFRAYEHLAPRFTDGSPEVYRGAKAAREIMAGPGGMESRGARVYELLLKKFRADSCITSEVDDVLQFYTEKPWLKEHIGEVFKQNFHHLSSISFFKAGFESGKWIDGLRFSERAAQNLRGFAGQPHFIGFRDSVMTVLDSLSGFSDDKRAVLNRVFEVTDPAKWKSVRNTVRTLRALATLDTLPEEVGSEFYASHGVLKGDTRARLRSDVEKTLLAFLREKVGGTGFAGMLFQDEAPGEKDLARRWRYAHVVRRYLSNKGLLSLFAQSASFMDDEGIGILRTLLGEMVTSPVVDGDLRYQKRYDRMVEQLGFSPEFVKRWSREWSKVREAADLPRDEGEARKLVMDQAAAQLAVHVNSTEGVEGEFKSLPGRLRTLTDLLKRQEADEKEIGSLHEIMEISYQNIRETYGDLFANSRIDIKNLAAGLSKGVKVAKNAALTEVTGLVEKIAFHGTIPTETCQRLSRLYAESTNGKGQPLSKLLWGQFKLANHVMDGEVMARRMIEVTRDEEGREHLLAERAYTAGGFAGLAEFDEDIVEHARGLGIERERVHFLDQHEKRQIPHPLATGALMYRDSGMSEVNPAFMKPFQMLPVTAMPMMSATMMFRTGT